MDNQGIHIVLCLVLSVFAIFVSNDSYYKGLGIISAIYFGIAAYGHFHHLLPWG